MRTAALRLLLLVATTMSLVSCERPESKAVVSITQVNPSGDVALLEGDRVTFSVTARVQGASRPSHLALVVQTDGTVLGEAQPVLVENGTPQTLQVVVVVPHAASIQVLTPVYFQTETKTDVVDVRHFKVVGKRG